MAIQTEHPAFGASVFWSRLWRKKLLNGSTVAHWVDDIWPNSRIIAVTIRRTGTESGPEFTIIRSPAAAVVRFFCVSGDCKAARCSNCGKWKSEVRAKIVFGWMCTARQWRALGIGRRTPVCAWHSSTEWVKKVNCCRPIAGCDFQLWTNLLKFHS